MFNAMYIVFLCPPAGSGRGRHICEDCLRKAPSESDLKDLLPEGFKFEQVKYIL